MIIVHWESFFLINFCGDISLHVIHAPIIMKRYRIHFIFTNHVYTNVGQLIWNMSEIQLNSETDSFLLFFMAQIHQNFEKQTSIQNSHDNKIILTTKFPLTNPLLLEANMFEWLSVLHKILKTWSSLTRTELKVNC